MIILEELRNCIRIGGRLDRVGQRFCKYRGIIMARQFRHRFPFVQFFEQSIPQSCIGLSAPETGSKDLAQPINSIPLFHF